MAFMASELGIILACVCFVKDVLERRIVAGALLWLATRSSNARKPSRCRFRTKLS